MRPSGGDAHLALVQPEQVVALVVLKLGNVVDRLDVGLLAAGDRRLVKVGDLLER
jgi:hypothetical protein